MKTIINELQKNIKNFIMKTNSKNSRKNNYSLVVVALFIISLLNFSCSKPENGTNGANGLDGKNGTNGVVGSANVIYSDWISFSTSSIQINANISQDILDKGLVIMYVNQSGNEIYQLPYNDTINNKIINSSYKINLIEVSKNYSGVAKIRYLIIPGGVPSGRGTTPKPDYSQMTYSQVCAKFNIPE